MARGVADLPKEKSSIQPPMSAHITVSHKPNCKLQGTLLSLTKKALAMVDGVSECSIPACKLFDMHI